MLPVNCGSHSDYQYFVVKNLRKYYPNPDSIARSTWDIIDRFGNLDLSYTNEKLKNRYSVCGPKPRTPTCCLWDSDEDNMPPHIHPIKITVKKPSTKGAKVFSILRFLQAV